MTEDEKTTHLLILQAYGVLMLADLLIERRDTLDENQLKTISHLKSGAYGVLKQNGLGDDEADLS